MNGSAGAPGPGVVPDTPLLSYFRGPPFAEKGVGWQANRLAELDRLLAEPEWLGGRLLASIEAFESRYRNYQPFYTGARSLEGYGRELREDKDVAARLCSTGSTWAVEGAPRLAFRYLDYELTLARTRPTPQAPPRGRLKLDLLLGNEHDHLPILCEVKLHDDQCAFYALVQLLCYAAYAASRSQRERLVLFGSRPGFVLSEVAEGQVGRFDLYVLLVEPPENRGFPEIREKAIALGRTILSHPGIANRIRRIAWVRALDDGEQGLRLNCLADFTTRATA